MLGKYRVDGIIGEGGMGIVLKATHIRMDRAVALKLLLPELAKHPIVVERFEREARASVSIKSEHVARVLDVENLEDGCPVLVMELLEGRDLASEILDRGSFPLNEAAELILQASEALAEAHNLGIVHRDLKPANLFLTYRADGSRLVKVMDFGIAKALTEKDDVSLTQTQDVIGSPLYMAPEQVRASKDVDQRADIWSLGVILYELVSGDVPFVGPSSSAVLAAVAADRPRPITQLLPDASPELVAFLETALQKAPSDRYANVAEFASVLSEFAHPESARLSLDRISRIIYGTDTDTSSLGRTAPYFTRRDAAGTGTPRMPHMATPPSVNTGRRSTEVAETKAAESSIVPTMPANGAVGPSDSTDAEVQPSSAAGERTKTPISGSRLDQLDDRSSGAPNPVASLQRRGLSLILAVLGAIVLLLLIWRLAGPSMRDSVAVSEETAPSPKAMGASREIQKTRDAPSEPALQDKQALPKGEEDNGGAQDPAPEEKAAPPAQSTGREPKPPPTSRSGGTAAPPQPATKQSSQDKALLDAAIESRK